MRTIDADALKELFSEVIGHIAKKPEMNGNLEHMIRASAMVIQMIDDAPTVQPYTTTHDSIPAETGKNDGDGTSGDCISRTQAIDTIEKHLKWTTIPDYYPGIFEAVRGWLNGLPSAQPEQHLDEWCVDCKEYDKEKHSCPRWNRVIRQTLLDAQPERKTGHWILDRSGAYCCSKCMEPCAGYVMMKPRDKFCKMCGSRNEVTE